ncbi:oxidoreductase [Ktedonobacter sp. SOSP1-85]|uniref:NAD-dependent epimerase/dehydratase family protein n=1 Tax=Ktedonobacter sp. SOSP1-85 TaxID=2778367 RepID=UPI0019164C81|nr:NAD-dependent epimerase/dehydratase family protein [Ktedonobacter sp. SOSP1-85]GHO73387.1 oxidoreductase [Ktedonobacter sp. SOSP1-85]
MTILVTGATGFLGSALVVELIKRQQKVRVLVRDSRKAREQFGEKVEIISGDITNARQVQLAVGGVDTLYHLAGRLYHPATPAALYYQTHVEGTRTLLNACQSQSSLRKIVHVSTTGVHGVTGPTPAAEDAPLAPTNPYERTKLEGEQLALKVFQEQGLPVSVVRPGLVYGPGDLHLLGFFRTIQKGFFRVIAGGKSCLHPVYIDDMVSAFLLSAESEKSLGQAYNIAGNQVVSMHQLATAIAKSMDRNLPGGSIPLWLARLASDIFAITPGLQGEKAPLTRSRVEFLTNSRVYDISRARAELGYSPRVELEEGLKQTAAWYEKHGLLAS